MAAYCQVYDSGTYVTDCLEIGISSEPYDPVWDYLYLYQNLLLIPIMNLLYQTNKIDQRSKASRNLGKVNYLFMG